MTIRKIYISKDDEEFDTKEECLAHEAMLDTSGKLLMFDEDGELLNSEDPGKDYEYSTYLYILNAENAQPFLNWIENIYGYDTPEDISDNELYFYNNETNRYENMSKRISELVEKQRYIFEQVGKLRSEQNAN